MSNIIKELEKEQLRTDLPKLEVGDTVRVFVKVVARLICSSVRCSARHWPV